MTTKTSDVINDDEFLNIVEDIDNSLADIMEKYKLAPSVLVGLGLARLMWIGKIHWSESEMLVLLNHAAESLKSGMKMPELKVH
jgi:hypothetical protein